MSVACGILRNDAPTEFNIPYYGATKTLEGDALSTHASVFFERQTGRRIMRLQELEERILALKPIPDRRCYCIRETSTDNELCLRKTDASWTVYFCERGVRHVKGVFDSEHDACEYYYCCCKKASDEKKWH
ncbi:MAG: hypothetical protein LBO81_03540 [Clostridiales Family XIII bacterium]|jgi:hypothetical protein|nr:hypothetical protein [Clostridiales Family XIII bacterium]